MPSMKFSRALYDFEAYLDVEKNLSPQTRKAYTYDVERFVDDWIRRHKSNPTLEQLKTEDIKRYLENLRMNRNYKSATLSRTMASIFASFLSSASPRSTWKTALRPISITRRCRRSCPCS